MIRALWTAATGMQSQQVNMDVIANNLANVNSSGFKKSRADFQDILYQTSRAAGTGVDGGEVPTGIQVGLGSRVAAVQKVFTTGDFQQTENDAFATAISTSFTLTTGADLEFFIKDGPNGYEFSGDNLGGISLATIPIPAAVWLFGSGLLGLVGMARRKKV